MILVSSSQKQLKLFRASMLLALPIAFLATAIIVVNNLRDRKTDVHAGKKTLAVRFGESFARSEYAMLILASYILLSLLAIDPSFLSLTSNHSKSKFTVALLYPLLTIPLAMEGFKTVRHSMNMSVGLLDCSLFFVSFFTQQSLEAAVKKVLPFYH